MKFFNKDSDWTEEMFLRSNVYRLLQNVDTKFWVPQDLMSDEEKQNNRGWKLNEGFYRDIPFKEAFANQWNNWSEESRSEFKALPNFDAEIFESITGVKVK